MATATRDTVMAAILTVIQGMTFATPVTGKTTWATTGNRLRLWGDVPPDQQPAAFLVTHSEQDEYRGLGLYRRRLDLRVYCYTRSDGGPGAPDLDTIMESFEAAFNPPDNFSTNSNTLGGLVYFCRIEGKTFKDPGDLDNQTMLVVPIVVEMP